MWFQISGETRGTRPTEALPDFGLHKMAQRTTPTSFLFGLFQGMPLKPETTFMNPLLILVHKCGLRFFARASEHDAKNDLKSYYSTLQKVMDFCPKILHFYHQILRMMTKSSQICMIFWRSASSRTRALKTKHPASSAASQYKPPEGSKSAKIGCDETCAT